MRRRNFIITFFGVHVLFIILYIYKQSTIIRLSYARQRQERYNELLQQQTAQLKQELQTVEDHDAVYNYAKHTLGMEQLQLSKVTVLHDE